MKKIFALVLIVILFSCKSKTNYDTIIRNGMIYDGEGGEPYKADLGIKNDTIAFIGDLSAATASNEIDAKGNAVAPGFINMLSWATESLIEDGNSQSDIRQGVTLEVMGEGWSMGPLNDKVKKQQQESQSDNRDPTSDEMESMKQLVKQAMQEGAMGVGTSLIYPPAFFAKTNELVELCKVASQYGGMYISHMRSEGDKLYEAVEELITIAKEANIPAEIYHLKAAGKDNWPKMDSVIKRVERARTEGQLISADIYTYIAGGTGLTATMPPTLQDGGFGKLRERLQDPVIRKKIAKEMNSKTDKWENFYYAVGNPEKILVVGFKQDSLKKYIGKSLGEVARLRGTSPEETAMDLIVQDSTRVDCIYFLMDENNIKKQLALPWVSFGSDEGSYEPAGVFLKSNPHPRAYGNFARVLGKYVREEKVITLQEAIRKLSNLPAKNLKIQKRGQLKVGNYADVLVFDPAKIKDNATFEKPSQYASGMIHVFVNGTQVLKGGEHTGAKPGRFVKGPGYKKNN